MPRPGSPRAGSQSHRPGTRTERTSRQLAAAQATNGYNVWKDYDGSDGIRALLQQIADRNRNIVKLKVIGQTYGTDPRATVQTYPARSWP